MAPAIEVSPLKCYEEAKKLLEQKDLIGFIEKISNAILLSHDDKEMLAKSTFLKAKGLVDFNQYKKALESIDEAINYNEGIELLKLKKELGKVQVYLGELSGAIEIFEELLTKTDDIFFLIGIYINITWVSLISYKKELNKNMLNKAKKYLDFANQHFDLLSNSIKTRILNNYGVYYFYREEYNKAIEIFEDCIKYSDEKFLPYLYTNLAEMFLKIEEESISKKAKEYLHLAEVLGTKYKKNIALGYTFYTKAMFELREDQFFRALDTLSLSVEYFKEAEAYMLISDSVSKIIELMDEYKLYLQKV